MIASPAEKPRTQNTKIHRAIRCISVGSAHEFDSDANLEIRVSDDYYRSCALPKPEPRIVTKKRREKEDAKDERACRWVTRQRDGGHCRIPNCHEKAAHLHHIIFRSKSKRLKWATHNCLWLCVDHHSLLHAGVIHISGNADDEIIVTGDVDRLRFRL